MSTCSGSRNPVEVLAEEFLDRKRRGEPATPEDYAERHPELADEILVLFPALLMMEDLGGDPASRTSSIASGAGAVAGAVTGQLGEFRLLREVGRGGMGVVYEAEQESLGRRVALKVLPTGALTDANLVRRFEREARSAARLHHTNIVPVFGVGNHEGTHFYVMQFIQGQGLDTVLVELRQLRHSRSAQPAPPGRQMTPTQTVHQRPAAAIAQSLVTGQFAAGRADGDFVPGSTTLPWSGPPVILAPRLTLSESGLSSVFGQSDVSHFIETNRPFAQGVARIGVQVAEALAYAHGQGILHRDIKPSNLLLDRNGNVWVADFGLAKAIGAEDLTHTGDVVGTLRYMAPERFRGVGDARADIYALGLTLYELLALRPAYAENDRASLIRQVTQEDPTPLRKLSRGVPADLETIVHKAMAREPGQRYATAGALAEDLKRFIDGRPILARRISSAERAWRWCRRNPMVAGLGVAIALALVVGTAVATYFAIRATRGERLATQNEAKALAYAGRADQEAQHANQEAERARVAKLLSDRRLYQAEISLAHQALRDGQPDIMRDHLQALVPVRPEDPDPRGFEWYYLDRLCHSDLTLHGGTNVAFSPDGRRLAGGCKDGTVRIWDATTGREVQALHGHEDSVTDVAYSLDGRRIASASLDHTIKLWDAATGQVIHTLRGHSLWVTGVSFSLDGRHLASGSADDTVRIWDAATGQVVRTLHGHTAAVGGVVYSPDGHTLASAGADRTVRIWDAATGQVVRTLSGHMAPVRRVAYSPDGRTLASACEDYTVKLWDAATGRVIHTLRGQSDEVIGVAYSPDGRQIAAACIDQTVKLYDAVTGQEVRTLRGSTTQIWSVAYSPDGRQVAAAGADETARVWNISVDQEAVTLRAHAEAVLGLAYSPDGRQIASTSVDRTVRIWDVATGQEVHTLRGHSDGVWSLAYSPDGHTLASASHDHTVKLWDAATGREVRVLRGHTAPVLDVAYRPDGHTLASASVDRTVRIWDAATGQVVHILSGHTDQINGMAYSPDGRTLASASSDHTVKLWDAATGREVYTLRGHTGLVVGVAYSPDGRTLASASFDHTVKLWEVATGQEVRTLRGRSAAVREIAFTPDGRRIASSDDDRTVKLWDPDTGQELLTLRGHTGYVRCVAFSPDGRTLASTGADGTIKLWDATPLTAELQATREARLVVESLFDQRLPTAEVLARIRRDATLRTEVGDRALALAEGYGRSLAAREAELLVGSLYARPMFRPEVLASLRTDASLAEPVRREALALAEQISEYPGKLDEASWQVVSRPGGDAWAYRLALSRAEAACRLVPDDAGYLNTLGIAQYRLGHHEEAVTTLTRSERLDTALHDVPSPANLAFLALAKQGLGQTDQARATLGRLRETMKRPTYARDEFWRAFLREAEVLDLDLIFPADPFAPTH
jgi:WD40 repeat protein/serine/threonine protein kinase